MKATLLTMIPAPGPFYEDGRRTFQLHFQKLLFFGFVGMRFHVYRCLSTEEQNQYKPGKKYTI